MGSLLSVPASSGSSFESDPRRAANSFPTISDDSEQSPLLDPPPISSEAEYGDTDDDNDEVIEDFIKADRDTKLFGNTPEAVEEYKQWAAKHVPVAKLPNACHPPSHTSETYDAPIAGRPLLHYGIGFKADELVRFAEKHQKLSAETRPVMFGMFTAKALARYLGIRPGVELAVVRPLSVDYAWVIAWYRTTGKFREPRVSKGAKHIIVKDVERILGEAREPLWWWDDCWTCSGNDRRGNGLRPGTQLRPATQFWTHRIV